MVAFCSTVSLILLIVQHSAPLTSSFFPHSHFTELEQTLFFLAFISLRYSDNLEIALSTHYLTDILMIYLFISCYRLLRLLHRTHGMGSERGVKTEDCLTN